MSNLTDADIEYISRIIHGSKIISEAMKEDLIDHFCCAVEEEMNKGLSFKDSYDKAYQNICPDGFDEIQRETVYLLTFKNIKAMKRLMYLSGYLALTGMTTTLYLQLSHLRYGGISLMLTAALLIFLFIPSLFMHLYKRELTKSTSDKLKYIFGFIGVELLMVFSIFRVNHWPWSTSLLLAAIVIINFAFFPFLFFKMYRKTIG